ncbi:four-carbon acid sugar kinase family protein [Dyadobacter bucti]|uniref:four-carbon acid sugar kinase family protein n=1 Tax=Dyadobacter bucti TaxID=2572203 RepID=UPI00110929D9|nr:four-carbon acid sugar kinase family protein [Dyadobacter bucti]
MDREMLLTFYGDDFTGSTDVMEALTLNGIPSALFLNAPSVAEVEDFRLKNNFYAADRRIAAFGVAGISRTMNADQMQKQLPPIFEKISKVSSRFFHYKVCSTFDSSPDIGNIGLGVEIALRYFPSKWIPLIVGAPALNRFCVFGNLFARVNDITYRLDRHPTMSRHPITPMLESDLKVHLAAQTEREISLMDLLTLRANERRQTEKLQKFMDAEGGYVLFDVLEDQDLVAAGKLISDFGSKTGQLIVGSSGVEHALCHYLKNVTHNRKTEAYRPEKAKRVIAVTGSCSPTTQLQIEWALAAGFEGIRINTMLLADADTRQHEFDRIISIASQALDADKHLVIYTALGPEDEAISITKNTLGQHSAEASIGKFQGELLVTLLLLYIGTRVIVAGGDTSGHVTRALDIYALELLAPVAPGAPLCLAHSHNPAFDGMEITLKGGQNGDEKYFNKILNGLAY